MLSPFLQTKYEDCSNPCNVNGAETHCDTNAFCVHVPETHDFRCECKPGFNGTGDLCFGTYLTDTIFLLRILGKMSC